MFETISSDLLVIQLKVWLVIYLITISPFTNHQYTMFYIRFQEAALSSSGPRNI